MHGGIPPWHALIFKRVHGGMPWYSCGCTEASRPGMPWYPCGCTATRNVVKAAVATAKALDTGAGILTEEANRLLVRTQPLPDVLRAQDDPDDTSPALRDSLRSTRPASPSTGIYVLLYDYVTLYVIPSVSP